MRSWLVAVGLAAATTAGSAGFALSADLNYRDEPNRYGSAYDDPRYADLYGSRPPPPPAPPIYPRPYAYGYGPPPGPVPPAPIYRDYERPPIHRPYAAAPYRSNCVPKDEVKYELQREGWTDFHDAQVIDGHTAIVRARRDRNGRMFELKVDRCTGEVVSARPLEPRPGPYADYDGNRRYRAY
jgi:hypothetical protein